MPEYYPGQNFYHHHNHNVRRAELNFFCNNSHLLDVERDNLAGDENTWNKAFRYYRAGGDRICEKCGICYYDHPVIRGAEKRHYGCELQVLCNTDRVKLK